MQGSEQERYEVSPRRSERVQKLNDALRCGGIGGQVMMTNGVWALGHPAVLELRKQISSYDTFSEGNDPYGEHDFGVIDYCGSKVFWKIDYYDASLAAHSHDPACPIITSRVLTVMLANEY